LPPDKKNTTLVIDQGTSSTKIFLSNLSNHVVFKSEDKHTLKYPRPGHVEADALAIAHTCEKLINGIRL
jgi:glycerol kinase